MSGALPPFWAKPDQNRAQFVMKQLWDRFKSAPPHNLDRAAIGRANGSFGMLISLLNTKRLYTGVGTKQALEDAKETGARTGSQEMIQAKRINGKGERLILLF